MTEKKMIAVLKIRDIFAFNFIFTFTFLNRRYELPKIFLSKKFKELNPVKRHAPHLKMKGRNFNTFFNFSKDFKHYMEKRPLLKGLGVASLEEFLGGNY